MANIKISELTDAGALDGTELVEIVQGGGNKKAKAGKIASTKRVQKVTGASGTVTCDWDLYDDIRITTVGTVNLAFSGAVDGQGCILTVRGGNTVNLPANVRYNNSNLAFTATPGGTSIDKLGFIYDNDDTKYDLVSVIKNIA